MVESVVSTILPTAVGAGAGFMVGGPWGAAVGAGLGLMSGMGSNAQMSAAEAAANAQAQGINSSITAQLAESQANRDFIEKWLTTNRSDLKDAVDAGLIDLGTAFSTAIQSTQSGYGNALQNIQDAYSGVKAIYDGIPEAAGNALTQYAALVQDPSKYEQTAGYKFLQDQGEQALRRNAAAMGNLQSGATGKALMEYGQGMASTGLDAELARLASLGQYGDNYLNWSQAKGLNQANLNTQQANALANLQSTLGADQANLRMGGATQAANLTNNAVNNWVAAAPNTAPYYTALGNAQASGQIMQGNALANMYNNSLNLLSQGVGLYGMTGGYGGSSGSLGFFNNSNALLGSLLGG